MVKLNKIYTRTGDDGTTGLGDGSRVPKTHARIGAYGTVDEANSAIGVVLALKLHIAFALGWLLVSYVAIGLVESILSLTRRAARARRRNTDGSARTG